MAKWATCYGMVDFIVADVRATLDTLEDKLGIPPDTAVRHTRYGSGFDAAYFTVNPDVNLSATGIQILGIRSLTDAEPDGEVGRDLHGMLTAYITSKPLYRPVLSHVTPFQTPEAEDINVIVEMLKSKDVPHIARIDNVYIGVHRVDGRIYYEPEADGGIQLEFAHSPAGRFPGLLNNPNVVGEPNVVEVDPGSLIRPTARVHLTDSIERILDRLRFIVDWPDEGDVELTAGDGFRSAIIRTSHPLSAVFELVEPTRPDSAAGIALDQYGPGPWANRLGVFDLEAKLDDLEKRGTRWERLDDGPSGRWVELNRWDLRGLNFHLEEMPVVVRGEGGGRY